MIIVDDKGHICIIYIRLISGDLQYLRTINIFVTTCKLIMHLDKSLKGWPLFSPYYKKYYLHKFIEFLIDSK